MNTAVSIDLEEAAQCLSTGSDELICLIQEWLFDSKRGRHARIVVRADEIERLAGAFKSRKAYRRRGEAQRTSMCRSESAHS
jgi:hypothetical protein